MMDKCKVFVIQPDCEVCGRRMHIRFLRAWNGKRACRQCIRELCSDEYYLLS